MSKWFIASTALILFTIAAPANADWFSSLSGGYSSPALTSAGGEVIMMGGKGVPTYSAPHGYPFYSSCCEPKSSCCGSLWAGYRPRSRCHHLHFPRFHRACGCGVASCVGCSGKGSHVSSKGAVQSGGCNSCGSKGFSKGHSKGCGTCSKGCGGFGLGLFSWLHAGCGCGTTMTHSDCGCSSGKGSPSYYQGTPVYEGPMNEVPTPVTPPTPEPVSTQSAGKWLSPLRFLPLK